MDLFNVKIVRSLFEKYGFSLSKGLGQNFLCERWVPEKIAELSGIDGNTSVIEVGPGIGALSRELCRRAANVTAIELDKRLIPILSETMKDFSNFELIIADVLKVDLKKITQNNKHRNIVCANLPYYITTPIVEMLIGSSVFDSISVMVQKEVAERICAMPGTKAYGSFTIYVNFYAKPIKLFDVPPSCFLPQPKVTSSVVKIVPLEKTLLNGDDRAFFFKLVRAAFSKRRKTLVNALDGELSATFSKSELAKLINSLGFPTDIRGERLSIDDFVELTVALRQAIGFQ